MNLDPGLPGKSFEGGIELFSQTNELDLIRNWLLEAPETLRILRVSHRVWAGADVFTVCCAFEPAKTIATREDYARVAHLWAAHTAPLDLPMVTFRKPIGYRIEAVRPVAPAGAPAQTLRLPPSPPVRTIPPRHEPDL